MKKRFLTVKPPDQTEVFARAMHSAFLLFMSWSYMQLVNINVEYFDCVEGGDGRSVSYTHLTLPTNREV